MLYKKTGYFFTVISIVLLCSTGCQKTIPLESLAKAKKTKTLKHLSMQEAIRQHELEYADNLYLGYREKNPDSETIPALMLRLAKAHMQQREYLLARYYTESYIRDYPDRKNVDEAWFLRLKSLFLRFQSEGSAENLEKQFQGEAAMFVEDPAYRKYHEKVREMLEEAKEMQRQRNEALAVYYEKRKKPKAAAFYRNKNEETEGGVEEGNATLPDKPL